MLDLETLRVVQAAIAVCAFVLVFLGTYLPTRAPFAAWWSAALAASGMSSVAYLAGEQWHEVGGAAVGNALAVTSAFFTWTAARSLVDKRHQWWTPVIVGLSVAAATSIERPQAASWPGGGALLVGMSVFIGLAAVELWALSRRSRSGDPREADGESTMAVGSLAFASAGTALFYAVRVVVYATLGPDSWFYQTWTGPLTTSLGMTIMLVVVTYSVTTLSHYEVSRDWKFRAMNDDLTGLLTRTEFENRARVIMSSATATATPAVIVADIDHFKTINDDHGHAEGDQVLVAYAGAIRSRLGTDDLAARFGGEEFVLLIREATREEAVALTRCVDASFATARPDESRRPTVSYGVALWRDGVTLEELMARADAALYRAKAAGRDRVEIDEHPVH